MKRMLSLLLTILLLMSLIPVSAAAPNGENPLPVADASLVLRDEWRVLPDKQNMGEEEAWYQVFPAQAQEVSVPYYAGDDRSTTWFFNKFTPDLNLESGQRVIAAFEGCQYYAKIWLNGNYIGDHEGSYGKFSFDVTDFLREDQPNLLAIRLFTANDGSTIRGETADALPQGPTAGQALQMPVYLSVVPQIAIADTFVDTQYENGNVNVQVIIDNPGTETVKVDINTRISPNGSHAVLASAGATFNAVPGLSKHTVTMILEDFHAWSPDDPYRYAVWVDTLAEEADFSDSSVFRVGFKDLRIDSQGYFMLNGERFYVKSVNVTADTSREQLTYYKANGVNMVRFTDGPALPSLLDACDAIGLLVYQETAMAHKADSEYGEDLIRREIRQLVERDRNHPSFAIVGVLNETEDTNTVFVNNYQAAVDCLDVFRTYDKDLLVFLSSGRFDNDTATASASNPGSLTWDGYLGNEGIRGGVENGEGIGTGDIHGQLPVYDTEPQRAVFVSDADVSMLDAIRANSKINGYSFTVDADTDLFTLNALQDTCWCVTLGAQTVYNQDVLPIEVHLSDLGKLEEKEYTARFTVSHDGDTVWQKDVPVTPAYTKTGSYVSAMPVLSEEIPLTGLAAGTYRLEAWLVDTEVSRTLDFYVTDAQDLPALSGTVYVSGLDAAALLLLEKAGLQVELLDEQNIVRGSTIVLGGKNVPDSTLTLIYEAVEQTGVTVIGADVDAFGDWGYLNLPFDQVAYTVLSADKTAVLSQDLLAYGLPSAALPPSICSGEYLHLALPAREILAGNGDAVAIGAYDCGRGTVVVNTLSLIENIGDPVADRLLLNLIDYTLKES